MTPYTISMGTIESSFDAPLVNTGHSPFYHYHDCNCFTCQENHRFYCGDTDCLYCQIVGRMLYTGEIESSSEVVSYPEFLTYDINFFFDTYTYSNQVYLNPFTYRNTEYLVKYFCVECNDRIGYDTYKEQKDGKELCAACQENQVFYCVECGDNEVEDDGDTCASCSTVYCSECGESEVDSEGDLCSYCEENQTDHIKYHMGDIVDSDDYDTVENCWIAPSGNMHYVPYCNHSTTSYKLGFNGVDHCERSGYIHVSVYWSRSQRFVHIPDRPTHAQINTIREYCDAWGLRLPSCAAYTVISEEKHEVQKLQNLNPAWLMMKRVQRDLFYKLSGD